MTDHLETAPFTSFDHASFNLKDNAEWFLEPTMYDNCPVLAEVLSAGNSIPHPNTWAEVAPITNYTTATEEIDDSETVISVADYRIFRLGQQIRIEDEHCGPITAISDGDGTITVTTRGLRGSAAAHSNGVKIHTLPNSIAEKVTSYTDTSQFHAATPTEITNYRQTFSVDISVTEFQKALEAAGRLKSEALSTENIFRRSEVQLKMAMENAVLYGKPVSPTNETATNGSMAGILHMIETYGTTHDITGSGSPALKMETLDDALYHLIQYGYNAEWMFISAEDWPLISRGWGDQRIISDTTTNIGHQVKTITTSYGVLKVKPLFNLDRNTCLLGSLKTSKMGPVLGMGLTLYRNPADAETTVEKRVLRGTYGFRMRDIQTSFVRIKYTGIDADGK